MTYRFNHGLSQSNELYELIRANCKILKAGLRFYPMCVQFIKLMINDKFSLGELTYRPDAKFDTQLGPTVFLSNEFAQDILLVLDLVKNSKPELEKEYLGLFPMIINDQGKFSISVDIAPDSFLELDNEYKKKVGIFIAIHALIPNIQCKTLIFTM